MPKQKTNKSLAKRIKVTGTGKLVRMKAGRRHLMSSKNRKRLRQLGKPTMVSDAETKKLKRMLAMA